ncbi:hypothetical protein MRX96_047202 [Rhipicephalus microplus]
MSRCNSSTTVEILKVGASCPLQSPSVCIASQPSRPPSPSVCIVTEMSRPPSPSVCIVRESVRPPVTYSVRVVKKEARVPSFCVVSSKCTPSPTTVYVVSEGEKRRQRKVTRSPNVCIVTSSSSPPPPRQSPDECIVTEERPPVTKHVHCHRHTQASVSHSGGRHRGTEAFIVDHHHRRVDASSLRPTRRLSHWLA